MEAVQLYEGVVFDIRGANPVGGVDFQHALQEVHKLRDLGQLVVVHFLEVKAEVLH